MNKPKFCPKCGGKLVGEDRFCGDCGFDLSSLTTNSLNVEEVSKPLGPPLVYTAAQAPKATRASNDSYSPEISRNGPPSPEYSSSEMPARNDVYRNEPPSPEYPSPEMPARNDVYRNEPPLGTKAGGDKKAIIIVVALLVVLFLGGSGLYWWLSKGEPPIADGNPPNTPINTNVNSHADMNVPQNPPQGINEVAPPAGDLTRAATYLSSPGLKCTSFVNYPDGMSGIVDRVSALVVPNETVRVSDVEIGVERGEEYGFGFHFVERADGTYYILDGAPHDIFPVLKNNLMVGQTWDYQDEWGNTTWTVVGMGVDLDLGFKKFNNCLLVREDNAAVDWHTISYYAPGYGIVYVISPGGEFEHYRVTDLSNIDLDLAADTVKRWTPNHQIIKDDRSQSF